MVGHLIGNLVPGVGNLTIKISKVQMPGVCPGGCLNFDLVDALCITVSVSVDHEHLLIQFFFQ